MAGSCCAPPFRQGQHRKHTEQSENNESNAACKITSGGVTQAAHQPRRQRLSNTARSEKHAQQSPKCMGSENFRSDQRNNHVVATKTNPENSGSRVDRNPRLPKE